MQAELPKYPSSVEIKRLLTRRGELVLSHKRRILCLDRTIQNAVRGAKFTCVYCKEASFLSAWSFIQNHRYTPPSGCSEGAYWNKTEKAGCHIICPHCSKQNYLYNHPQREEALLYMVTAELSPEKIFLKVFSSYKESGATEELKQTYPIV